MITIKHATATLTVLPQNAEPTRALLALIDKSKGAKGAKLTRPKGNPKHDSTKRFYPVFEAGMSTADYLTRYAALNVGLNLAKVTYIHADRPAAMLDPSIPEVIEETTE